MRIQILDTHDCGAMRAQLVDLLFDAVAHGGWLGLPAPLDSGEARRYWDDVEAEAKALGRDLLFLDTEAGSGAEQLYHGLGYTCVAEMPAAACIPHGAARPTALYYKTLLTPAHA